VKAESAMRALNPYFLWKAEEGTKSNNFSLRTIKNANKKTLDPNLLKHTSV
jgi:hypothetical protein